MGKKKRDSDLQYWESGLATQYRTYLRTPFPGGVEVLKKWLYLKATEITKNKLPT
jgi:hypothetical protein